MVHKQKSYIARRAYDTPEVLVHCKVAATMNFPQMQTKDACMIANVSKAIPDKHNMHQNELPFSSFRMARLVRPLWNLAHDDFAPD